MKKNLLKSRQHNNKRWILQETRLWASFLNDGKKSIKKRMPLRLQKGKGAKEDGALPPDLFECAVIKIHPPKANVRDRYMASEGPGNR